MRQYIILETAKHKAARNNLLVSVFRKEYHIRELFISDETIQNITWGEIRMNNLRQKKLFLFDIDGTLAVGDTLYEGSAELLDYIASIGGKSYFITNNSTRSGADYVEKFRNAFGLATTEDQFITSGYMTVLFLLENYADKKIFVLGTNSFVAELRRNGLRVVETAAPENICLADTTDEISGKPDCPTDNTPIACVVVAYDSELTYDKLVQVCKVLSTTDVPFYATNPDLCCSIDFGFIPDCGAICNMITESTGKRPIYLGKPSKEVVELCLAESGFSKEETLVVGDRLYTDIACGINGGVDTCVVFTGEASRKDMATTEYPATYCFENIKELLKHCTGTS